MEGEMCRVPLLLGQVLPVGALRVVLYEKSCAVASQCSPSGKKYMADLNFYTDCCDSDLRNAVNSATTLQAPSPPTPASSFLYLPLCSFSMQCSPQSGNRKQEAQG